MTEPGSAVRGLNGARGEVIALLAGVERRLCLTLGALAEIETALGVDGIGALAQRMRTLSARDLTVILAALMGGGADPDGACRVEAATVEPREAAEAIAKAFAAAA